MSDYASGVAQYSKALKRRLVLSRMMGLVACLIAIVAIVFMGLDFINRWFCLVMVAYSMGLIFLQNCNLQGIRIGNPWQRINAICSLIMFMVTVFILAYSYTSGLLSFAVTFN